jgi:hypothetical protein
VRRAAGTFPFEIKVVGRRAPAEIPSRGNSYRW